VTPTVRLNLNALFSGRRLIRPGKVVLLDLYSVVPHRACLGGERSSALRYVYSHAYLKNSRASSMNFRSSARLTPVAASNDTVTMSMPRKATILPQSPFSTKRAA
jgi:hypothetical protein